MHVSCAQAAAVCSQPAGFLAACYPADFLSCQWTQNHGRTIPDETMPTQASPNLSFLFFMLVISYMCSAWR